MIYLLWLTYREINRLKYLQALLVGWNRWNTICCSLLLYLFLPHLEAPLHSCGLYRHSTENWQCSTSQGRNRRGACTPTLYGRSEKVSYRKRVRTGLWWRSFTSCDVEIHGPREKRLALHSFFLSSKNCLPFHYDKLVFLLFFNQISFFLVWRKELTNVSLFCNQIKFTGHRFPYIINFKRYQNVRCVLHEFCNYILEFLRSPKQLCITCLPVNICAHITVYIDFFFSELPLSSKNTVVFNHQAKDDMTKWLS